MTGEPEDTVRRARLANERTYLAWWRTGLATLAVSIGAGQIAPALAHTAAWPYEVIGVVFAAVGLAFIAYGYIRWKAVEDALECGAFARFGRGPARAFAVAGVALALATVVVVVAHPG